MRKTGLQANLSKFFGDIGPCFGLGYCLEMTKEYTMNIKESVLAMPLYYTNISKTLHADKQFNLIQVLSNLIEICLTLFTLCCLILVLSVNTAYEKHHCRQSA